MACTTILVGKKASYDGSTLIARNDDGGFEPKRVVIITPDKQKKNYKSKIGHLEIELPDNPLKYSAIPSVNLEHGFWSAAGINSANVSMTATETITSNPRVLGADPYVYYEKAKTKKEKDKIGGIGEEDLITITLPYIKTAREGVARVAELLEKYGTYEPNGMAFSDEIEIWWLETIGGHHYIARKVKDDEVVIMPNQFGLDKFDLEDAFGAQKENICSKDLREFIKDNHLDLNTDGVFNPRYVFGSHDDSDHIYNTPRAWFMMKYFLPTKYSYLGENSDFNPESDNLLWSFVPEKKVTVEDIKYVLSSYYQGTPYNPYGKDQMNKGKYRVIGVPNSDDSAILQVRGYEVDELKGVEWISLGGSGFTGSFAFYTNVNELPAYLSNTPKLPSTEYFYWQSRFLASLTDAHYFSAIIYSERYRNKVFNKSREILNEYDKLFKEKKDLKLLEEANKKIIEFVKEETSKTLNSLLLNAGEKMKTRYHRGDN